MLVKGAPATLHLGWTWLTYDVYIFMYGYYFIHCDVTNDIVKTFYVTVRYRFHVRHHHSFNHHIPTLYSIYREYYYDSPTLVLLTQCRDLLIDPLLLVLSDTVLFILLLSVSCLKYHGRERREFSATSRLPSLNDAPMCYIWHDVYVLW